MINIWNVGVQGGVLGLIIGQFEFYYRWVGGVRRLEVFLGDRFGFLGVILGLNVVNTIFFLIRYRLFRIKKRIFKVIN